MIVKINNIIISLIISTSYLYPNTPSISIESKYGEGEKKDAITYEGLGNYYYNETIMDMNFNFDYGFSTYDYEILLSVIKIELLIIKFYFLVIS